MEDMRNIKFSQLDLTERFGDNTRLNPDEWIETVPIISTMDPVEGIEMGLVSREATDDEVYQVAANMSQVRDLFNVSDDGVYCPICHRANVDIGKLGTPCPNCGRPLLRFGWD